jgi:hypothetical protein
MIVPASSDQTPQRDREPRHRHAGGPRDVLRSAAWREVAADVRAMLRDPDRARPRGGGRYL